MARNIEDEALKADEYVMRLCEPGRMTPRQAVDYLEQVIERCQSAIEALKEGHPDVN